MTKLIRYYRKHTAIPIESQEGGIIQHNKTTDRNTIRLSPNIVKKNNNIDSNIKKLILNKPSCNYWIFDMADHLEKCHVLMSRLTVWGLFHNFQKNIPHALEQLSSNFYYQPVLQNYAKFIKNQPNVTEIENYYADKILVNDLVPKDILNIANICRNRYVKSCNLALSQLEERLLQQGCNHIVFEAHDVVSIGIKSFRANTLNTIVIHIAIADPNNIKKIRIDNKSYTWDNPYYKNIWQDIGQYDLIAVHKSPNSVFKKNLIRLCKDIVGSPPNIQEFVIGMNRKAQRNELKIADNIKCELVDDIVKFLEDSEIRLFCGSRADLNKGSDKLIRQLEKFVDTNPRLRRKLKIVFLLQETYKEAPGYKDHIDQEIIPAVERFCHKYPETIYFRLGKYIPHSKYLKIMSLFNGFIFTASDDMGEGHNLHISEIATIKNNPQHAIDRSFFNIVPATIIMIIRRFTNYKFGANNKNFDCFIVTTNNMGASEVYKEGLFISEKIDDINQTITYAINSDRQFKAKKMGKLMELSELYNHNKSANMLLQLAKCD